MQNSAASRSADTEPVSQTSRSAVPMSKNALLLQGPIGPFFSRFANDLTSGGFNVTKVNFNGGDRLFYRGKSTLGTDTLDYAGTPEEWEAWIERVLVNCAIGRVYLFGDCRSYHKVARAVAKRLNIRVFVFEEGYIRPNFITLEEDGVNGHSDMMSHLSKELPLPGTLPEELQQPGYIFQITAIYSMLYYMASAAQHKRFVHYRHHRPFGCLAEGGRWIRSGMRKLKYARSGKSVVKDILSQYDGNYFFCPLQVHCDMQVTVHSNFNSIEHFIGDVLASFCEHADSNKAIVFKHHPMDRGYKDYTDLFDSLVAKLGLQGRVFYVHDACLPTLLKHAQGTVLINSTVGLSSLFHGTPVKTLGKAIYDVPGLTVQKPLDEFWSCARKVNGKLFRRFRSFLIHKNQLNGNLYRRVSSKGATGILWSEELAAMHTWKMEQGVMPPVKAVDGRLLSGYREDSDDSSAAA